VVLSHIDTHGRSNLNIHQYPNDNSNNIKNIRNPSSAKSVTEDNIQSISLSHTNSSSSLLTGGPVTAVTNKETKYITIDNNWQTKNILSIHSTSTNSYVKTTTTTNSNIEGTVKSNSLELEKKADIDDNIDNLINELQESVQISRKTFNNYKSFIKSSFEQMTEQCDKLSNCLNDF
jgi:hypothetical protein